MSRATGIRRCAALLAQRLRTPSVEEPFTRSQQPVLQCLVAASVCGTWSPQQRPLSSRPAGAPPIDQLPLPEEKLTNDLEDVVRGEADDAALLGSEDEQALATAAARVRPQREQQANRWQQQQQRQQQQQQRQQQQQQQEGAKDALADLPMGQGLRQEAQLQGRTWTFETGRLARLANGSCLVQSGGTTVLAAASSQAPPWSRRDAFSLQFEVDYREKLYAVGRIPSTYNKREGSAKEHEVLAARRIGRALRPLFPKGFAHDAAVFANVLSADGGTDPDVMAVSAGSAALLCSDMPWAGPVAAARVALLRDGQLVAGPSVEQQESAALDVLVACTAEGRVTMLEAEGDQVPEAEFFRALRLAVSTAQQLVEPQRRLAADTRRRTKPVQLAGADPAAAVKVAELATPAIEAILRDHTLTKASRAAALQEAKDGVLARLKATGAFRTEFARLPGSGCVSPADLDHAFTAALSATMRRLAIEEGWRCDGRGSIDVRPVHCEVDSVPVVHGSALFTRGETQSLCTATVGRKNEQQKSESLLGGEELKRIFVNYSFPAYAINETSTGGNRREVGHSELAERALLPVLPDLDAFPFSLRLNADTLASSGSSSMAAVCGGSLALADAGVPLKALVAGVSVGLLTEPSWGGEARSLNAAPVSDVGAADGVVPPAPLGRYELLLDLQGIEDQLGDMDLKVAGTRRGITAAQLDVKLQGGVPLEVLEEAVQLAARGRDKLLGIMEKALPQKRSASAPTFGAVRVPEAMVGRVIGTGGSNLRELEERLDVRVEVASGVVSIFAPSQDSFEAAEESILNLAGETIKEGGVYRGRVSRLMDFGAMLELAPSGMRVLLHISEVAAQRVRSIEDVLQVGQEVDVLCVGRDAKGQIRVSRKALLAQQAQQAAAKSVAAGGGIDADK